MGFGMITKRLRDYERNSPLSVGNAGSPGLRRVSVNGPDSFCPGPFSI